MSNKVFANGRELACKAGSGKSICAFPDVCMTLPETPATPPGIPIPYPNTGLASDTTKGSKAVKISGKEVMLKNQSFFKKSTGDEAGAAKKKGVVTGVNRGKVYFNSWSMDVRIEGQNVVRHLDMTTHNHASMPGQTPPWPFIDSMAISGAATSDPCATEKGAEKDACEQHGGDRDKECADEACQSAQACKLVPYGGSGSPNCCPGKTGHHLVEVNCFTEPAGRGGLREMVGLNKTDLKATLDAKGFSLNTHSAHTTALPLRGFADYSVNAAPTVCADRSTGYTDHGAMHAVTDRAKRRLARSEVLEDFGQDINGQRIESRWTYEEAARTGAEAHKAVHPHCSQDCTKAQLDAYHTGPAGIDPEMPVRTATDSYQQGDQWLKDNR